MFTFHYRLGVSSYRVVPGHLRSMASEVRKLRALNYTDEEIAETLKLPLEYVRLVW